MVELISKTKAEGYLINYFDLLDSVGYVKAGTVKKFLAYTFLLDFVENMHAFITEEDYILIERMLGKLFSGGNCLLPYPVFCTRCATLGDADYMGYYNRRITESGTLGEGEDDRITEDERLRTA